MNTKELIGIRIKNRRIELGLTQLDLAKKIGYNSRSMISLIESGQRALDVDQMIPLTQALQCSISDILDGEESKRQAIIDALDRLTPDQMDAALHFFEAMTNK